MGKLSEKWRHWLEEDSDTVYQGQWVGFYNEVEGDLALVIHCTNEFAPTCMQLHHLSLPIPVQCCTVGTYSRCHKEWENPVGSIVGFFHKVKIIHTTQKKKVSEKKLGYFTGKWLPWVGTPTGGAGPTGTNFLITPQSLAEKYLVVGTLELRAWRKNGKVTSRPIIGSIDPKCGTLSAPVKKLHSCGPFGIRLWQPMSGGPKLLRPLFPNNAHFSSRTLVNQSSTNFGTVSKQGGHGNGPYSSCMNSVGLERVITIASIGSKHCLERGSKGNLSKKSKFGIFFVALRYGQFGSNVMTKCSTPGGCSVLNMYEST